MDTEKNLAAAASKFSGIYNLTASGQTSWFGFAELALSSAKLLGYYKSETSGYI